MVNKRMIEDVDNDDNEASWVAGRSSFEGKPNQHFLALVQKRTSREWFLGLGLELELGLGLGC